MSSVKDVIKSSIITAFTIAAALIWKDVIVEFIAIIVPPGEELFYKFIAAVIATIFAAIAIYLIMKAESETEFVIKQAELFVEKMTHKNSPDPGIKKENTTENKNGF
jgi:hypothetical protein